MLEIGWLRSRQTAGNLLENFSYSDDAATEITRAQIKIRCFGFCPTYIYVNIPLLDAYLVYLCHTYLFNHLFSIFMLYIPLLDIIWFWHGGKKKGPFRTPDFDSCPSSGQTYLLKSRKTNSESRTTREKPYIRSLLRTGGNTKKQ